MTGRGGFGGGAGWSGAVGGVGVGGWEREGALSPDCGDGRRGEGVGRGGAEASGGARSSAETRN